MRRCVSPDRFIQRCDKRKLPGGPKLTLRPAGEFAPDDGDQSAVTKASAVAEAPAPQDTLTRVLSTSIWPSRLL
jgi:hypothetical protein